MICKIGGNMNIKVYDKSGIQDMFRADVGSAGFDIRSNGKNGIRILATRI